MGRLLRTIAIIAIVCAAGGAVAMFYLNRKPAVGQYRTVPIRRTEILATITATGTLVPEDVVDVGAQVNGQIASFGTDVNGKQIDYRSEVEKGMVLAKIDDSLYAADVATSHAQLEQAQSQVQVAQANYDQAVAKLNQATRDWERAQRLGQSEALSQVDYDAAKSAYEQATAAVAVAQASIGQANAAVQIAQAAVLRAERNLAYCTISSPVSGVIIDKRVEIGQTVVASLNAPSLFLIARDLSRMQVLVQVNEADVGSVHPGQAVNFTTDAYPGETFHGQVRKVRLNATMTQNVVTYTVEIVTENPDLKLLPYLTANVRFVTGQRDQVLAVPNAALRFTPSNAPPPAGRSSGGNPAGSVSGAPATEQRGDNGPTIWLLVNGQPQEINVATGLSEGTLTEISSPEISEGQSVIVGEESAQASSRPSSGASPFTPQMPSRRGRR